MQGKQESGKRVAGNKRIHVLERGLYASLIDVWASRDNPLMPRIALKQ
jgi:hypothetical protein